MRRVIIPLIFSEVFPGERVSTPNDALMFRLRQLNRTQTLLLCAHLNLIISDPWHPQFTLDQQWPLIAHLFDRRAIDHIKQQAHPHSAQKNGWKGQPTIFHREQLLEFMRLASLHCPDAAKYQSPRQNNQSKKTFVQAALLISELLLDRTYVHANLGADADTKRKSTLEPLRHSARYASNAPDPLRAFGRGKLMFFEYMPQELPDFHKDFQKHVGLSLDDYYACLFLVMSRYIHTNPGQIELTQHIMPLDGLTQQLPHITDTFQQYLTLDSSTPEELQTAFQKAEGSEYSLKPIRERPLLHLPENQITVLDSTFHCEKAMAGPLFALPAQIRRRLLGNFGNAFEKYAQTILATMYPQTEGGPRLIFNERLGSKKRPLGDIDASMIEGDQLLLFEMKAVWIRESGTVQPDFEDYLTNLQEYTKGTRQLANTINNLISGKAQIKQHDMQVIRRIYPILVVYDSSLSVPGYAWFFANEFQEALDPDGLLTGSYMVMTKGQWEIAPLTVMPIDVLENLEASIQSFTLADLLKDYFAFRDTEFQGEADTLALSEFITLSDYQQKINTVDSTIVKKALEIFQDAVKTLLPEDKQAELLLNL